jgi:hypothetical protein
MKITYRHEKYKKIFTAIFFMTFVMCLIGFIVLAPLWISLLVFGGMSYYIFRVSYYAEIKPK